MSAWVRIDSRAGKRKWVNMDHVESVTETFEWEGPEGDRFRQRVLELDCSQGGTVEVVDRPEVEAVLDYLGSAG